MIQVTHIITGLEPDGAEKMLHRLVAGMDSRLFKNDVVVLSELGPMAEKIEASGVRVRALGMRRGTAGPSHVLRLAAWLRKSPGQLVQTWMYHADLVGGLAAKLAGLSAVIWNIRHGELRRGIDRRHTIWTARLCAHLSRHVPRRIVCCSHASRKIHEDLGYASDRMQVIPNGFDLECFKPDRMKGAGIRNALGIPLEVPVIGLVARKHQIKDHRSFMQAAGLLHREFRDVRFLCCGEGVTPNDLELRAWAQSAGIQDVCHLIGQQEDIPGILNALDLATSASTAEAFPNAVAEAMACGIPCVVTDVGDSRLIVGDTGRVVPPKTPAALARAWAELLKEGPGFRRHLGSTARERIEKNFGLTATINQFQDLYQRVAAESSAKRLAPAAGAWVSDGPAPQAATGSSATPT